MFSIKLPKKEFTPVTILKPTPPKVYTEDEIMLIDKRVCELTPNPVGKSYEEYRDQMISSDKSYEQLVFDIFTKKWKIKKVDV